MRERKTECETVFGSSQTCFKANRRSPDEKTSKPCRGPAVWSGPKKARLFKDEWKWAYCACGPQRRLRFIWQRRTLVKPLKRESVFMWELGESFARPFFPVAKTAGSKWQVSQGTKEFPILKVKVKYSGPLMEIELLSNSIYWVLTLLYIAFIYIYSFSRHIYPKLLTSENKRST